VPGIRVGHQTLVQGMNVRTGVTAIRPHAGNPLSERLYAGICSNDSLGGIINSFVLEKHGLLSTPIVLTGRSELGIVMHAVTRYLAQYYPEEVRNQICRPFVAECDDSYLHEPGTSALAEEDVWAALDAASVDPVVEGSVGAGTGTHLFGYKGGIGSSSRVVPTAVGTFTVGVLVQASFGLRSHLVVAGVPVGHVVTDLMLEEPPVEGSYVVIVATDAPLHSDTLHKLARYPELGLARTSSVAISGIHGVTLAFSTAQRIPYHSPGETLQITMLADERKDTDLHTFFSAVSDTTEEAVINALLAAIPMTGRAGRILQVIPHDRLREVIKSHVSF